MAWQKNNVENLSSSNVTIDVTPLTDQKIMFALHHSVGISAGANTGVRLNGVTTNTYANRISNAGGADTTAGSITSMVSGATSTQPYFEISYLINIATEEKLNIRSLVAGVAVGAGTVPFRNVSVGKHAQTTNPVSSYQWITTTGATFDADSEVNVLSTN